MIRWLDVDLKDALALAAQLDIYAYDAYIIAAAQKQKCRIHALDGGLHPCGKGGRSTRAGGEGMKVYTNSEARQSLASLLEQAKKEGAVRIRHRDGQTCVLRPEFPSGSPFDVEAVDLGVTTEEIVSFVREGRRDAGPPRLTNG